MKLNKRLRMMARSPNAYKSKTVPIERPTMYKKSGWNRRCPGSYKVNFVTFDGFERETQHWYAEFSTHGTYGNATDLGRKFGLRTIHRGHHYDERQLTEMEKLMHRLAKIRLGELTRNFEESQLEATA